MFKKIIFQGIGWTISNKVTKISLHELMVKDFIYLSLTTKEATARMHIFILIIS